MSHGRDGVVQAASTYLAQIEVILLGSLREEAVKQLIGIGATTVDVVTRMAALQTLHLDAASVIVGWHINVLIGESTHRVNATSAADENLALVFRIKVQQNVTMHEAILYLESAGKARLLVTGEEALDGTML